MFKHLCIIATLAIALPPSQHRKRAPTTICPPSSTPAQNTVQSTPPSPNFRAQKPSSTRRPFSRTKDGESQASSPEDKTSYFGKLYITADQVAFVPTQPKDEHLAWTMKRPQFTLAMTATAWRSSRLAKTTQPPQRSAPLRARRKQNRQARVLLADEPSFLHKKKLDPPMQAFLDDLNALIATFGDTFKRLSNEAGG